MTGAAVTAVVLNHARPPDTLECLSSLARSTYPTLDTIVLDTGHVAGAAEAIRQASPGIEIVELEQNLGYAGNNNVGLALALRRGADFVLLLNDDVVIATDCVAALVAAVDADPEIGIAGPTVFHHDEPVVVQSAGGFLTRDWSALPTTLLAPARRDSIPTPVEWLPGCALLVRSRLCSEVGTLHERFFMYWEDVEWCLRAARNGWRVVHVPAARVWHKGARRDETPPPAVAYYTTRNQLVAFVELHPPTAVWCLTAIRLVATLIGWSVRPRWRRRREHRTAMWWGIVDFARCRFGRRH